jgi:exopolyphosphatase/guanosine-5'-triphosphate,3'-diphosphate pyrophosphatase
LQASGTDVSWVTGWRLTGTYDVQGKLRDGITLPIGPLRLIDMSGGSIKRAKEIVDEYLEKATLLGNLKGRSFYAVGGTWRNLARLHMAQNKYPLHVLHHYAMTRQQASAVADLVIAEGRA